MFGNSFFNDYKRGMEALFAYAPLFAPFAQALGTPKPDSTHRAAVAFDKNTKRITFVMDPEYIATLTDEEIGAVIAHETYHVVLQHLLDLDNRKMYPDVTSLVDAQECIINDGLEDNLGLALPENCRYGTELYNQSFAWFSTKQGYDFIRDFKKKQEEDDQNQQSDEESDSDGQASGGGAGADSGSGSNSPENQDEEQSDGQSSGGDQNSDSKSEDDSENTTEDGSGTESGDDSDDDHAGHGFCGGIQVDEEDLGDFVKAAKKMIQGTLDQMDQPLPTDLSDALTDFDQPSFGIGNSTDSVFAGQTDNMNMNWRELLAKIDPRVKSRGRLRARDTWARPRRRMMDSYPNVILPSKRVQDPNPNKRGSDLPVFLIALDLSGSIPESLTTKLVSLVEQVPAEFIVPHPVTWSDSVLPWDAETRRIVLKSGTNIDEVYNYAEGLAKENGKPPYVLVITDGDCGFGRSDLYFSNPPRVNVDLEVLNSKWFWMGISPGDTGRITYNFVNKGHANANHVFDLKDFTD